MELWFFLLVSLCISVALRSFFTLFLYKAEKGPKILPPGPSTVPIIGSFLWLRKSFSELEPILRRLRTQYGPIMTLHIGSRPAIFISTHELTHQALIQNGAIFANRPPPVETSRLISSNQHNISSASYGPLWRSLRRNLTSEILHPSRVKSYAHARKWVSDILVNRLRSEASGEPVRVVDHFQYAMFCLLALMCFGEKLDEKTIRKIEAAQRALLSNFSRFGVLNFFPRLGKIVFRNRWKELEEIRRNQESVLLPLIRTREENKKSQVPEAVVCYVDTLLDLQLPDEKKRNLNEDEMVSLCSEFLNAGTDTTATALQWIMANLVKHQDVQAKLFEEIQKVMIKRTGEEEIKEEDLQKMPYLKAVVLEGLRRHPPGHFVLPHAVTEDFPLDGYVVPKNGTVNFMVADMGWDPKVWEDPMEFKPERFLSAGEVVFDITGSREIKMMPFGVGRRICPGLGLALLHLEYFVANLVREFEWTAVDGDQVDLSEKQVFTVVMKNPLRAVLYPRVR